MTGSAILLIRWRPKNYYSFASLVPILQQTGYELEIVKKNMGTIVITHLTKYSRVFIFDSFMSIDVPKVKDEMVKLYRMLGKDRNRVIFSAGGSHPTAAPEHTLSLGFDIAARGEGEVIIECIVNKIQEGRNWSEIPGIAFNDQGFIQYTKNPPRINLDEYQPYSENPPVHPPIEIMRGCSFGCKFCQTPRVLRKVRYRSLERIDAAVKYYASHFQNRNNIDIRFIAPNSLEYGSKDHRKPNINKLWDLVKTVKKYPVRMFLGSFPSEVRPEFVIPETVEILQESAAKRVAIGAQSGSDRVLDKMNRGHTVEDILNCVDYLLDGGLIPQLDFIFGNPYETRNEIWQTINMIKELIDRNCRVRLHYFMPLPGTPWNSAPPTKLSADALSEIGKLLQNKKVEGSFSQQVKITDTLLTYH